MNLFHPLRQSHSGANLSIINCLARKSARRNVVHRFPAQMLNILLFDFASQPGTHYTDALKQHRAIIAKNVTTNLLDRHIKPLFL
jgi:hypothetical protein